MKKRSIFLLLGGLGLALLICVGAGVGGVLAYKASQTSPVLAFAGDGVRRPHLEGEAGLLISSVQPDSPAAEAGLARGDILLAVDGEEVNSFLDLQKVLAEKSAGDQVELSVLHGDEQRTLMATLDEMDDVAFLGILPCGPGFADGDVILRVHPGADLPNGPDDGAYIMEIQQGSPAEKAGLKKGESILSVDGEQVGLDRGLAELIGAHQPGDSVELEVKGEDGETRQVSVVLAEHPEESGKAYLGVSYAPARFRIPGEPPMFFRMDPDHVWPFELPEGVSSGVLVGQVVEGSPADQAGLQRGDLITAIDGEPVQELNPKEFAEAVKARKPGDALTLNVVRHSETEGQEPQTLEIEVVLGEDPEQAGQAYLGIQAMGFIQIDRQKGHPGNFEFQFKFPEWLPFHDLPELPFPNQDLKPGVEV